MNLHTCRARVTAWPLGLFTWLVECNFDSSREPAPHFRRQWLVRQERPEPCFWPQRRRLLLGAVGKIESVVKEANYTLKKLENYKSKDDLLAAVADVDAMIIRSDIVDQAVFGQGGQAQDCCSSRCWLRQH